MKNKRDITSIFKPYLSPKKVYEGGKNIPMGDKKIIKLSSNENPLGASPKALQAAQAALEKIALYPDQTDIRLREALARDFDNQLNSDQFITGNSGSEIIDMLLRAFIKEGDEVIYSSPSFLPYSVFSRWYGAQQIDVPLLEPTYELDVQGILKAITNRTKMVFLTSPNNPTGTCIPKKSLDFLLAQLPKNILIVFDEVYRHFVGTSDYVTAVPYVHKGYNIVGLNSFSKTYGLAGLRIGYAYTTSTIAHYVRQIHKPFLLPLPSLEAAIGALEDADFMERTIATVKEGRKYLEHSFTQLGIHFWPSQANFFLIDPPLPEETFVSALMEYGIMVRPVSQFGAKGKVRISIGNKEANETLAGALKELLKNKQLS